MMEKQLYNRQYFFIMKISKKNIMYDCVFHTVERSSYMCKKTKEQKFIMLPSVDFCFQELMEDEEVRRGFIGAFLRIPPEEILDMELLPKKLRKKYKEEKYGILDVRVRLREGEQLNIEMQSIAYDYWQERSLFYLGKMYVDQIHEGEDYDKLKKCIHVGILDFTLFEHERYYSCFHIWEDTIRDMYSDKFEIHVLELPKLAKYEYPQTELLRWAQFFGARSREEIEVLAEKYEYIHKAYDKLIFQPCPLVCTAKKCPPATKKQLDFLMRLVKQKGLQPAFDPETLTRNEASRLIDSILSGQAV